MKKRANEEIRKKAKEHGVCLWQIGERLGVNDRNFSCKLRHELSENEKFRIFEIIGDISKEDNQCK